MHPDKQITAYYWCSKSGDTGWRVTLKHPREIGLPFNDFEVVELTNHPTKVLENALRDAMRPYLRSDPGKAADIFDAFMAELRQIHTRGSTENR